MNSAQAVCNYSLLHFLPYPETGVVVNVGVLVICPQPCFFHFLAEEKMPESLKLLFPRQNEKAFETSMAALKDEVLRVKGRIRDPKSCQIEFNELVRPRQNTFRFGEVRKALTADPRNFSEELFRLYVRMEAPAPQTVVGQG
jgi:hypothetical protein